MTISTVGLSFALAALALLCWVLDKRVSRLEKLWAELVPDDDFSAND